MNKEQVRPIENEHSLSFRTDEIDFFELVSILWKGKLYIIFITTVFAIGSIYYALTRTEIYRSEALLAPSEQQQGNNNSIFNSLGGGASLVGVDVTSQGNSKLTNTLAILESREFITQFIQKHNLLVPLMGSKWSDEQQDSIIDPSLFDEESQTWVGDPPTLAQAFSLFDSIFTVSRNDETGLITISIEWYDPMLAQEWVELIILDINDRVKEKDLIEAASSIEYLQNQLQSTQLIEMQRVFSSMIESQMQTVMLADVREEYILQVIDSPVVPEEKIRPRRAFICIIGTFSGGVLSLILVLIMHLYRERRQRIGPS